MYMRSSGAVILWMGQAVGCTDFSTRDLQPMKKTEITDTKNGSKLAVGQGVAPGRETSQKQAMRSDPG